MRQTLGMPRRSLLWVALACVTAAIGVVLALLAVELRSTLRSAVRAQASSTATQQATPSAPTGERLVMQGCGKTGSSFALGTVHKGKPQCGYLTVPIDHADPTSAPIAVSVRIVPATGPNPRYLFVNPGGPGAWATDLAADLSKVMSPQLRAAYTVVGMDPRGTGPANIYRCMEESREELDTTPDTAQEWTALAAAETAFLESCQAREPTLSEHMSSVDVARDLNVLRQELGADQVDFYGISYGTLLGYRFAEVAPTHVRHLLLDGPVAPDTAPADFIADLADASEDAFIDFSEVCAAKRRNCPLGQDPEKIRSDLESWLRDLDRSPQEVPTTFGPRPLHEREVQEVLAYGLSDSGSWDDLWPALAEARAGDPAALEDFSARYLREWFFDPAVAQTANGVAQAQRCSDFEGISPKQAAALAQEYGPVGAYAVSSKPGCTAWDHHAPPRATKVPDGPVALIVSTTLNTRTPGSESRALAAMFTRAEEFEVDLISHRAMFRGITCADRAAERFLLDGTIPRRGQYCAPAPSGSEPA